MKTAELEGGLLDNWVARAQGVNGIVDMMYMPSTDWAIGGPIIERERICIEHEAGEKLTRLNPYAYMPGMPNDGQFGKTVLLAAMRCFVASKFGEEVPG